MASVPAIGPGAQVIRNNMREARRNGMSRNMATAATYYWFFKMVRNRSRWDYKQFAPTLLTSATSILVQQVRQRVYLKISFLWEQDGLKVMLVHQSLNGGGGIKNRPMAMTQRTSVI